MYAVVAPELADINDIAELLDDVDRYYGGAGNEPRDQRNAHIREALFGETPAAHALVVRDGASLIGFAAYSFLWPAAGTSRSLFLKELYVAESDRRQGVGALLMQSLFEVATKHGCSRVEWHADDDNPTAVQFYEKLGFQPDQSKRFYRASGEQLARRLV